MEDSHQEESPLNDFSIKDLKKTLDETNQNLVEALKNRYMQDLLASMVFFVFNEFCKTARPENSDFLDQESRKTLPQIFFEEWKKETKKTVKKELLEINEKLKDDTQMNFLSAISNFSLPSTEDYQSIYDKALLDVQKIFEKNTKN